MTTIGDVREALAAAVSDGTGLRCHPYMLDQFAAPCALVERRQMDPRMVFGQGHAVRNFAVRCYFPRVNERAGQIDMDSYCELSGERSVIAAIQNEDNWPNELIHHAVVVNVGDTLLVNVAGAEYLSVAFDVEVVW